MPRKLLAALKTFLYLLLGMVMLGFIINILSEDVDQYLTEVFGPNKTIWLIGIGIAVFLIVFLLEFSAKESKTETPKDDEASRDQLITGTLKRYESRRKSKLTGDITFEMDLQLRYIKTETKDPVHKQFVITPSSKNISNYNTLFTTFYSEAKRLLILGQPGSGKTLLLIKLAEFLMDKAKDAPQHPIPIIINLAGWRSEEPSFEEWMEKQLPFAAGEGGISKEYAKVLMAEHRILPLLDGLDEVPEDHRKSCLENLEEYLRQRQNQVGKDSGYPEAVICSRIEEFRETESPAPVFATVEIKPLSQKAVRESLEKLVAKKNKAAGALLADFKKYTSFRQALDTSFYVHTALSMYPDSEGEMEKIVVTDSLEKVQEKLVKSYINQEMKKVIRQDKKAGFQDPVLA